MKCYVILLMKILFYFSKINSIETKSLILFFSLSRNYPNVERLYHQCNILNMIYSQQYPRNFIVKDLLLQLNITEDIVR